MPRPIKRVKHLIKHHVRGCTNRENDTLCACEWSGKYKGQDKVLSKWADKKIDPRTVGAAELVLRRFCKAIDDKEFDPAGERPPVRSGTTLSDFIDEWRDGYAAAHKLSMSGLGSELTILQTGTLGTFTLEQIAGGSEPIEKWLNSEAKAREWSDKTWCEYHGLLNRLCKKATRMLVNGKPRMSRNPMPMIERREFGQPEHFKTRHLLEDVEDRLFAVVDQLDRPQHRPNRNKLTQAKADAIRKAVTGGALQKQMAAKYGVSETVVSQVIAGTIWNPARYVVGTKGKEMRRRLMAAIDLGLRAGEMLLVKLKDVDWKHPVQRVAEDGTKFNGYVITLPHANTKTGKRTKKNQEVLVATLRLSTELEARRFQLRNDPEKFLFGTEQGHYQASFDKMWHELFELAGLDWGRDKGLVWHTTRHEATSRVVEQHDIQAGKKFARHASTRTTEGYAHDRNSRNWDVAAGLDRSKSAGRL